MRLWNGILPRPLNFGPEPPKPGGLAAQRVRNVRFVGFARGSPEERK